MRLLGHTNRADSQFPVPADDMVLDCGSLQLLDLLAFLFQIEPDHRTDSDLRIAPITSLSTDSSSRHVLKYLERQQASKVGKHDIHWASESREAHSASIDAKSYSALSR